MSCFLSAIYTTTDNVVILGITALATIIITVILTVVVIQLRSVHLRRKNKGKTMISSCFENDDLMSKVINYSIFFCKTITF